MTGLEGTYRLVKGILRDGDGEEISYRPGRVDDDMMMMTMVMMSDDDDSGGLMMLVMMVMMMVTPRS